MVTRQPDSTTAKLLEEVGSFAQEGPMTYSKVVASLEKTNQTTVGFKNWMEKQEEAAATEKPTGPTTPRTLGR